MQIAGIALLGVGIVLIAISIPNLYSNSAFTAYNYYEEDPTVNGQLGLMSLGALLVGLGAVLFGKGITVKKQARRL